MKVSAGKNIYVTGGVTATDNQGTFTSSYFEKASVVFGNALVKLGGLPVEGAYSHNLEGVDLTLDYAKADVYMLRSYWDNAHTTEHIELLDVNVPAPLREASLTENTNFSITLSPNPAHGQVRIASESNLKNVVVMDLTGNNVLSSTLESTQASIDVSALATGIYFCKIETEQGTKVQRLVIE
jgi:hypothetical protein